MWHMMKVDLYEKIFPDHGQMTQSEGKLEEKSSCCYLTIHFSNLKNMGQTTQNKGKPGVVSRKIRVKERRVRAEIF